MIGAAISAGASLVGGAMSGLFQRKAATTAFRRQKALMDYQNNINQSNELTSASRQMSGMKAAGLNAAAALGQGVPQSATVSGASAPQADMSGIGEGVSRAGASAVQGMLADKEIEQRDANIALTREQERGQRIKNDLDEQFSFQERSQRLNKLQQDLDLGIERIKGMKLSNMKDEEYLKVAGDLFKFQVAQLEETVSNLKATNRNININTDISATELKFREQRIMLEMREISSRIGLNSAQATAASANAATLNAALPFVADLSQAQLKKFNEEIAVLTQKASNMKTEGQKLEFERDVQSVVAKYADKREQAGLSNITADTILKGAKTVESGTQSVKNIKDTFFSF